VAARSPEYGLRPLRCSKAHRRGHKREREEHGELGSGLTRAQAATWRPGDGGAEPEATALGGSEARAWREAKRGWEMCGDVRGWCSPFIMVIAGARLTNRRGRGGKLRRCEPKGKTYSCRDTTDTRAGWADEGGFRPVGAARPAGWLGQRPSGPQGRSGRK
jgi:hypothetical protein